MSEFGWFDRLPAVGGGGVGVGVSAVVAVTPKGGIGKDGGLPWKRLGTDMALFKHASGTTRDPLRRNAVVMGRKTWESIPKRHRPLTGRLNVVLSTRADVAAVRRESEIPPDVLVSASLDEALRTLQDPRGVFAGAIEQIVLIGGAKVYEEAFARGLVDRVVATLLGREFECDTFVPWPLDEKAYDVVCSTASTPVEENGESYHFVVFDRKSAFSAPKVDHEAGVVGGEAEGGGGEGGGEGGGGVVGELPSRPSISLLPMRPGAHEEMQYLDLVRDIISSGLERDDRTGVGTLSKFGVSMRFSLRNNTLPLLTTKRVFWRGVAEELLWFLRGSTDAKLLAAKKIHIWDGNGSREFLDSRGLTDREEGDLGPVYGFQWRHFGAAYEGKDADYSGKGVDQIADVISKIKHDPTSRRILLTAWNPAALPEMALPPCHLLAQFYVDVTHKTLSCQMYQRSADMGLGVPFNIASYALLTHLLAKVCGLEAAELVHVIGDAHVYKNHVEPLREQLKRAPRPFPTLQIDRETEDIQEFKYEDFTVHDYKPHPKVKMEMAV